MGEEKWIRRRPGRVSGTVVPPPVGEEPPPLPQRRGDASSRHRSGASPDGGRAAAPPPVLPDNVRPLLRPVLQSRAGQGAVGTMLAPGRPKDRDFAGLRGDEPDLRPAGTGRRHVVWLAALTILLLLTATGTTVALLGQGSGSPKARVGGGKVLAGAAAARVRAATWVSREVSRSAIVGCDAVMCR
ncbi:MAG: hypothetical protein ACTHKL_20410, partial [Streptosporangiaceae bacterium]